jgi:hypothetical protein
MKPSKISIKLKLSTNYEPLTNFPESCTKLFVVIEHSRELITMVKDSHQAQELFGGYRGIHIVIP